jgi:hypothetical protein
MSPAEVKDGQSRFALLSEIFLQRNINLSRNPSGVRTNMWRRATVSKVESSRICRAEECFYCPMGCSSAPLCRRTRAILGWGSQER